MTRQSRRKHAVLRPMLRWAIADRWWQDVSSPVNPFIVRSSIAPDLMGNPVRVRPPGHLRTGEIGVIDGGFRFITSPML